MRLFQTTSTTLLVLCASCVFAFVPSVQGASFDCGKAGSKVEKLICSDAELSKLDDEMAQRYARELEYELIAYETKAAQKQWMKERNSCLDKACVKRTYLARLQVLRANQSEPIPQGGRLGKQARYVIYGQGHGQGFCEAILAVLNKNKPTEDYLPCISEEILKLPGVSDPPWQKLDMSQHVELAKKILTLSQVGEEKYFREPKDRPANYPTPEQQQGRLERVKALGAEMFVIRMPPEWHEDHALVTLIHKDDMCGRPWSADHIVMRGEVPRTAWVTDDLKEIASRGGALPSFSLRPILYKGRFYKIRPSRDSLEIEAADGLACDIQLFGR